MLANKVYEALQALKEGKAPNIDLDSLRFLEERGLVSLMEISDYTSNKETAANLIAAQETVAKLNLVISKDQEVVDELKSKLSSRWQRTRSYMKHFGSSGVKDDQGRLNILEEEIREGTRIIEQKNAEIEALKGKQLDLEGYVDASQIYVRFKDNDDGLLLSLKATTPRLGGVSYDDFKAELTKFNGAISERYGRFKKFYDFLREKGFSEEHTTTQLAVLASHADRKPEEIYSEIKKIDNLMEQAFSEEYGYGNDPSRLVILALLLNTEGEKPKLVKELKSLFELALDNSNSNSWTTLFEQAICLKIPSNSTKEKFSRYNFMQHALDKKGWGYGSAESCYIAANLSRMEGDVLDIADEFRTLEKKLVEKGIKDSVESGYAALMLMEASGTLDEKADRFIQAYNMMQSYSFVDHPEYYSTAAEISMMSGTIEENVQWLTGVTIKLQEEGFRIDLTNRALPIIHDSFEKLQKEGVYFSSKEQGSPSGKLSQENGPDKSLNDTLKV